MPAVVRTESGEPLLTGAYVGPTPVALLEEYTTITTAAIGAPFFVAEIDAFQPVGATLTPWLGWGMVPWAMLSLETVSDGEVTTIHASDVGYRTKSTDPDGVVPYPALLTQAFTLERQAPIAFGDPTSDVSWGSLVLSNADGGFDGLASSMNSDGRAVAVRWGAKTLDDERGIWLEPAYGDLALVFAGIARAWFLDANSLRIPLRDASYWLERPYQTSQYGGTGDYGGDATLVGTLKPRTRGGTAAHPVRRVRPVRISSTRAIYQYSDAPGTVQHLYEGAAEVFTADGDVGDLFSTTAPAPGHWQTDNAHAAFELGSEPVNEITCDVTGEFPIAGAVSVLATIARYMITEDMELPSGNIDLTSFSDAATDFPYTGGLYFSPDDQVDAATAVFRALSSFAARLVGGRTGELRCFALRALTGSETPVLTISLLNCADLTPIALPATLDPPPYRVRVAHSHNYTVATGSFDGAATAADKLFAASADQFAQFTSGTIGSQYAKPNDLAPFGGGMLIDSEAQTVCDAAGALLCARRRQYEAKLPVWTVFNAGLDLGDVVRIVYPIDDLRGGQLGQIVRENFSSSDNFVTVRVFV